MITTASEKQGKTSCSGAYVLHCNNLSLMSIASLETSPVVAKVNQVQKNEATRKNKSF